MLNISENTALANVETSRYHSFKYVDRLALSRVFGKWLSLIIAFMFLTLFLPWTQNIQSKGSMTSLDPSKRPQTIHSTIPGRIEKWYVNEGDFVKKGDTIVYLSEIKPEYFDTLLLERTLRKIKAKEGSIVSYEQKIDATNKIIDALTAEQKIKTSQLKNKIQQAELDLNTYRGNLQAAENDYNIAKIRLKRYESLFEQGLKSQTDVEEYKLKIRETEAKFIKAENAVELAKNKREVAQLDYDNVINYYGEKISKAVSDRASVESSLYDAKGALAQLENSFSNYKKRSEFNYITAPQDAYITKAIRPGIGEMLKAGEPLVSIMPGEFKLAAEIYIEPVNLPLMQKGQPVSLIFDGWPTVVFSGWPSLSYGTFYGKVYAIDNFTNEEGKYRVLVAEDESMKKKWPDALRPGSGAQGLVFLNDVPVWYEIWRQLNGFPPDYYKSLKKEGEYEVLDNKAKKKK